MARRWVYVSGPVDWWAGWTPLAEAITRAYAEEGGDYATTDLVAEACSASLCFRQHGWEGDGDWRISGLPDPDHCDSALLISVKQGNNGTCFFWSPMRLLWLNSAIGCEEISSHSDWIGDHTRDEVCRRVAHLLSLPLDVVRGKPQPEIDLGDPPF